MKRRGPKGPQKGGRLVALLRPGEVLITTVGARLKKLKSVAVALMYAPIMRVHTINASDLAQSDSGIYDASAYYLYLSQL
ncbi:hypothetical protein AT705_06955 [Pseudoalteromonas rubra]|uniref:Uncharacterized protein n=1 Tax=Pseudoalteromonas rubra TaxID=43658 RepID=A0A0U3I494_9GAMM|nr:hypothetical protein AT705_06955 [Pseudoalteromonas rubra]